MKALKKIAISSRKNKKEGKNLQNVKNGGDKKKLSKEEKDQLYDIFVSKDQRATAMKNAASFKTLSRVKSPPRFEKTTEEDK